MRVSLLLILLPFVAWAQEQTAVLLEGRPVVEVIEELRGEGLNVAYSTNLVTADLVVQAEPAPGKP